MCVVLVFMLMLIRLLMISDFIKIIRNIVRFYVNN